MGFYFIFCITLFYLFMLFLSIIKLYFNIIVRKLKRYINNNKHTKVLDIYLFYSILYYIILLLYYIYIFDIV